MKKIPSLPSVVFQRRPLYQQAVEALRERLSAMFPGDCLPSEKSLAAEFGVSLVTIREAIRILASEGRLDRKQGKGTFVAAPRNGVMAIAIDQDIFDSHTSSIYPRIAQEVRRLLEKEGLPSRLYIGCNPPAVAKYDFHCPEFFRDLKENRIRGLIGVLLYGKAPWLSDLGSRGIGMTGLGEDKECGVVGDVRNFYSSAVDELARRGRRRIAFLGWRGFPGHIQTGHANLFREILAEAGLPIVEEWIKDDTYPPLKGGGWEAFREIWSAQAGRPDGLLMTDDFFLNDAFLAMASLGVRVPEQMEIAVCFSHHSRNRLWYPLIAWQADVPAIARALVDAAIQLAQGKTLVSPMVTVPIPRVPELDQPGFPVLPAHSHGNALPA